METSIVEGEHRFSKFPDNHIDEGEIELAKKASRAFAVGYVNEIYNTIKSMDSSALKKFKITQQYPYYLHLFIHQEKPGEIERLEIYSEEKLHDDGLCGVGEIYHDSETESSFIKDKKKNLTDRCVNWKWFSLEVSRMYTEALSEGKRIGKSIYNHSQFSSTGPSHNIPFHRLDGFLFSTLKSEGFGT